MDLQYGPEYDEFRAEVKAFLKGWPLQGDEAGLPAEEQEQLFAREDLWGLSDPDAVSIDRALCALSVAALLQGVTGRDSDEGCALSLSTFERCVDRVG